MTQWIETLDAKAHTLGSIAINYMGEGERSLKLFSDRHSNRVGEPQGKYHSCKPLPQAYTFTHLKGLATQSAPGNTTLVINTLVMLSGLSPSGLGGPKSCSPSPFSKLYKKAGFKMCCRT